MTQAEYLPTEHHQQETLDVIDALIAGNYQVEVNFNGPVGSALKKLADKLKHGGIGDLNRVVDVSICANETSISSAQLLYNLKCADDQAQSIAAAAEQLQSSIEQIRENGQSVREGNQESSKTVDEVCTSLNVSVTAFEKIRTAVLQNSEQVGQMAGFASEIRKIAEAIKDIAFQTNLLALNASVEAARAGSIGAGFAVVAQEMRVLSNNSSDATKLITDLVDDFEEQMKGISGTLHSSVKSVDEGKVAIEAVDNQMDTMRDNINNSSELINQISYAIEEQGAASSSVSAGIGAVAKNTTESVNATDHILDSMNHLQDHINEQIVNIGELDLPQKVIKLAQSDHVIWKKRLLNMISGKEGLNDTELADHHSCRLGKWYDKVTDSTLTSNPLFKQLLAPHEKVHSHGKLAVQHYNNHDVSKALEEINIVEHYSAEVLRLLKEMERI